MQLINLVGEDKISVAESKPESKSESKQLEPKKLEPDSKQLEIKKLTDLFK